MTSIVALPSGRLVAAGHVAWTSDDGGLTWQRHDAAFVDASPDAGVVLAPEGLIAAGNSGESIQGVIWASKDGSEWVQSVPEPLSQVFVSSIATHAGRVAVAGEFQPSDQLTALWLNSDGSLTPLIVAPDGAGRIARLQEINGRLFGLGTDYWVGP